MFGSTEKNNGVVKDNAIRGNLICFEKSFISIGFDTADKMFTVFLPLVKAFVALIPSVHYADLIRFDDPADKRTFSSFFIGK
jgi:hypothetical protein